MAVTAGSVPRTVAIIMDWQQPLGRKRLLPGVAGHKAVVDCGFSDD